MCKAAIGSPFRFHGTRGKAAGGSGIGRNQRRAFLPASIGRLPSFWKVKRGKWWNPCRRSAATDEGGRTAGEITGRASAARKEGGEGRNLLPIDGHGRP